MKNKQNDSDLLSMTRTARNHEESLEKYRTEYQRQNAHPSSPIAQMDSSQYAIGYHGNVCGTDCEEYDCFNCEDEIDDVSVRKQN